MGTGYTVFLTYQFEGAPYSASTSYGYSSAIHCNKIIKIETGDLSNKGVNVYFSSVNDLPFLVNPTGTTTGYGWTAYVFNVIAQIVVGTGDDVEPTPHEWRVLDLTSQINNHTVGDAIDPTNIASTLFGFTQLEYNNSDYYDISYINHPTSGTTGDNKLTFGEEVFFFGNVSTDIKATAYTTDIPIQLPLNEFNSTTNPTWDGESDVQISEIGIYDDNNNLVAIGKLNQPISKSSEISRTIIFAMDF